MKYINEINQLADNIDKLNPIPESIKLQLFPTKE